MDKKKQIEEMAEEVKVAHDEQKYLTSDKSIKAISEHLYNAGYRKSEDVAREIFEEIEKTLKECLWFLKNHPSNYPSMDRTKINVYKDNLQYIAELKKKYIGKDTNVTTNTEEGK